VEREPNSNTNRQARALDHVFFLSLMAEVLESYLSLQEANN
jgi:hypothetical protein